MDDGSNSMRVQLASLDLDLDVEETGVWASSQWAASTNGTKVTLSEKVNEIAGRIALNIST